ncbi:hypothetical protein J7643_19475 [bacterium]|nr:hypothetical protein [bacterium]
MMKGKVHPMNATRLSLVVIASMASTLGCAQAPAIQPPQPAPQAEAPSQEAAPAPIPHAVTPAQQARTFGGPLRVPPRAAFASPGFAQSPGRYGGAMGYQGGANLSSWPNSTLRDALWAQLLGPNPAQTGQGSWGYARGGTSNGETSY